MLEPGPFLAINADVWMDYPYARLRDVLSEDDLAHLVLVDNPGHNPAGDFVLADNRIVEGPGKRFTFSGLGVYRPELFEGCRDGQFKLAPLLRAAAGQNRVSGERYEGGWLDVGTPERLAELDKRLS